MLLMAPPKLSIHTSMDRSLSLKFVVYSNGTVMIYKPFRLQYEDDVSATMTFLGRIEERLHDLLVDKRIITVPQVSK